MMKLIAVSIVASVFMLCSMGAYAGVNRGFPASQPETETPCLPDKNIRVRSVPRDDDAPCQAPIGKHPTPHANQSSGRREPTNPALQF